MRCRHVEQLLPWWRFCLILKIHRLGEHVRRVNRLREQNGADKGEYRNNS